MIAAFHPVGGEEWPVSMNECSSGLDFDLVFFGQFRRLTVQGVGPFGKHDQHVDRIAIYGVGGVVPRG